MTTHAYDPRLSDILKSQTLDPDVVIIGYPDDEGIRLNKGREGAAGGPAEFRHWLFKMTPHARRPIKNFADLGDMPQTGALADRHEAGRKLALEHLKQNRQVLSIGGGNDYAYADGIAFLEHFSDSKIKPLVINIDAHLDVRDTERGLNSGTPFYRLLESQYKFDFVELGVQSQCNSKAHWEYVENKGGKILALDELLDSGKDLLSFTVERLGDDLLKRRPLFLAIDLDAFAWPYAIGTSASWPIGLTPQDFWPLYLFLLKRMNVASLGIYELSPRLDVEKGTAKWAALLGHGFLHHV